MEQLVGAAVHLVAWCSRKAYQERIEVTENGRVFAEDGTMRLVEDNQVETTDGELLVLRVDVVDHRLVGAEHQTRLLLFFLGSCEGACSIFGQQLAEVPIGLIDQRNAIGKEQYVLNPVFSQEYVTERNGGACLARACSHDQKGTPMLLVEMLANGTDGSLLVIAVGDVVVYTQVLQLDAVPSCYDPFKVFQCVEA